MQLIMVSQHALANERTFPFEITSYKLRTLLRPSKMMITELFGGFLNLCISILFSTKREKIHKWDAIVSKGK